MFDLDKRRIMDFGKTIEQNKSVLSIFWKYKIIEGMAVLWNRKQEGT